MFFVAVATGMLVFGAYRTASLLEMLPNTLFELGGHLARVWPSLGLLADDER